MAVHPWHSRPRRLGAITGTAVMLLFVLHLTWTWLVPSRSPVVPYTPGMSPADVETFARHAVNNTVVIVPVNTGMLHWVENLLCSLKDSNTGFNPSDIIFWALDEGAESVLKRQGRATYRDPSLFSSSKNENLNGNTPTYRRMMRERPRFYMDILSTGYDILMVDADIVFWQSPLVIVPDDDDRRKVDMVYSTDNREFYLTKNAFKDAARRGPYIPPVCNGLFWMKSNNETIALWAEMLDIFEDPSWFASIYRSRVFQDDQRGMDVLLNDGRARLVGPYPDGISEAMLPRYSPQSDLNIRLLDQAQVVNGHLYLKRRTIYEESLERIRKEGRSRIAAHMNWSSNEMTKEEGARQLGLYYLDEKGQCKI